MACLQKRGAKKPIAVNSGVWTNLGYGDNGVPEFVISIHGDDNKEYQLRLQPDEMLRVTAALLESAVLRMKLEVRK